MHVGFTGTRNGMTQEQRRSLKYLLARCFEVDAVFHHGDCMGADVQAAEIAAVAGWLVTAHPGYPTGQRGNPVTRAYHPSDHILTPRPFLDRDHDIVDACSLLLAAPAQVEEQRRSGTWTTIRYARRTRKDYRIILPSGLHG